MGKNIVTTKLDAKTLISAIEALARRECERLKLGPSYLKTDETACRWFGPQIRAMAHELTGEWWGPSTSVYRQVRVLAERMVREGLLTRSPLENGTGAIISYWPVGLAERMRQEGAGNDGH